MAATAAYGKLGDYQQQQQQQQYAIRQMHQKRSASASQCSSNAVRLQQRRLIEQENIDQLLQKCRTSQRGIGCSTQVIERSLSRYYSIMLQYYSIFLRFVFKH